MILTLSSEPNMLGAQVAMSIDDPAMAQTCGDQMPPLPSEIGAAPDRYAAPGRREFETRVEQNASVIGKASLPIGKMDRR